MHLDELRKYYKTSSGRYTGNRFDRSGWYVGEWEKYKLEKYVELITLSRATLLMTIHEG